MPSQCQAFFLQAGDGIRDTSVTGVQTCALPIYHRDALACCQRVAMVASTLAMSASTLTPPRGTSGSGMLGLAGLHFLAGTVAHQRVVVGMRSEERRVGQERSARPPQDAYTEEHN